jgi:hypothetical protein
MIYASQWLGFFDLSEMLKGVKPPDVYCLPLTMHDAVRGTSLGSATCDLVVSGWDAYHDGLIRYWMLRIGRVATANGAPTSLEKHIDMIHRSTSAQEFIGSYLHSKGLHVIPAALSMPLDLRLIEGDGSVIDFDPETESWRWITPDS